MRIGRIVVGALVAAVVALPASTAEASVTAFTGTAGTAWWTDPVTGRTVVSVDDSVEPARAAAMRRAVHRGGGQVVRESGTLRQHIAGGDPIGGLTGRCLLGFNARAGVTTSFLTSAHCVPGVGMTVYGPGGATLGVVTAIDRSHDVALVRHTNSLPKPSAVNLYAGGLQPITSFSSGTIGQAVRRTGPSGVRAGYITALNVTVNYAGGTVHGLIRTTICSQPGESGGPLFAGSAGIGITSGGSGNCTTGGASYYASARRAATAWGVAPY